MGFHRVHLDLPTTSLEDVGEATRATLAHCDVELIAGTEVAIAVGSRGIRDLVEVVRAVAAWVRAQGASPFLVPAMGSHGGASAEGQTAVLESYGLSALGLAIRATMDVVELAQGSCPVPVVFDAHAASAAATIVVNRVKPHTDFHGLYESGLMKMVAIGLGKRIQAERLHAFGTAGLREIMPQVARQMITEGNVVLGVGIVENALDRTMLVEAVPAASLAAAEPRLLDLARRNMPRLPVDELDVLLVDQMGKDISGVGMDTNVIGRTMVSGETDPPTPRIRMIGCHRLTAASHGNACGMGLADVVTSEFAVTVDREVTNTNVITSGFLLRGKLPVVASDARELWEWCLRGAGVRDGAAVRAVRILDTLHCSDLWVSDAILGELRSHPGFLLCEADLDLHTADGSLVAFDGGGRR